ncbi:hypothetical protein BGZ51_001422 [Haplosporangium sp. Z 767]|nr:hypothetical protein BGZ51_001422 [Haplosporangium sp. Z 767]KAF9188941.1 hypothetical protein BGZ50_001091 [Haplosporangium sp. Z 11]
MRFTNIFLGATALAVSVVAAPTPNMAKNTADVLNYALTLEHLESEFYKQGLAKFDASAFTDAGFNPVVRERFIHIGEHENDHVSTLISVLESMKVKPVPACEYNFPMDNVAQFLAVAQALENTGVSAYLGAASRLNGDLLTAAASITTIEARHAAYLNELMKQLGFPYSFDTPLGSREIVTVASNFIKSCPYDLGVKPFTQLSAILPTDSSNKVMTSFTGHSSNSHPTFCQFLYGNKVSVSPRDSCVLPADALGYVFVLVTSNDTPVSLKNDKNVLAGPALLFNGSHSQ